MRRAMLHWLRIFRRARPKPTHAMLLNEGLALAMDWGENWLAPIQDRLLQLHPRLRRDELDEINAGCQEAMNFGHRTVYAMVREQGADVGPEAFAPALLARHPWVNAENSARLFSQSVYYACKAGGPSRPSHGNADAA